MNANVEDALDDIEVSFRVIDREARAISSYEERASISQPANDAIEELNHRFREHRIGYQYVDGQLIRVDSQYVRQGFPIFRRFCPAPSAQYVYGAAPPPAPPRRLQPVVPRRDKRRRPPLERSSSTGSTTDP
jgi:hypothetical protein